MTRIVTPDQARHWLRHHGLSAAAVAKVMDGIDPSPQKPICVEVLQTGDQLVQFRDRASASHPLGDLGGQWFALPSLHERDMGRVGIGSGLAGRTRHVLTVRRPVEVLESTARAMPGHPSNRYIGPGGATQIFIPDRGLSSLS
jgi:hypothetical protein